MKIGYYLGSSSVEGGGVGPFGQRVAEVLAADRSLDGEAMDLVFFGGSEPESNEIPWRIVPDPGKLPEVIREENLDLLHFPSQRPPVPVLDCPFTVTMHDVQELHYPEFFSAEERRSRAIQYLWAIRKSAGIAVSFKHVKTDLLRYFNVDDDKVSVLPLPYDNCISQAVGRIAEKDGDLDVFSQRKGRYFLYPAQTWEHKNHLRLIEAFERVCSQREEELWLVCTGKKNDYFGEIEKRLKKSPVESRIVFSGIVAETTLAWFYQHALAVVIPSLYEAGSFPLIESMAHRTPVVCSSTTSLPDTIGNPSLVFDPNDPEEIAERMCAVAFDADFRTASVSGCSNRFRELTRDSERRLTKTYIEFWKKAVSGRLVESAEDQHLVKWLDTKSQERVDAYDKKLQDAERRARDAQGREHDARLREHDARLREEDAQQRLLDSEAKAADLTRRLRQMSDEVSEIRYSWSFRVGYYLLHPWKLFERVKNRING